MWFGGIEGGSVRYVGSRRRLEAGWGWSGEACGEVRVL